MKRAIKWGAAIAVAALVGVGVDIGNDILNPPVQHTQLVSYTLAPKIACHWWGCTATFSQDATKLIASGAGGAIGTRIGGGWGIVAGYEGAKEMASQAVEHGNCLEIVEPFSPPGTAWFWRAHCSA